MVARDTKHIIKHDTLCVTGVLFKGHKLHFFTDFAIKYEWSEHLLFLCEGKVWAVRKTQTPLEGMH